jgi:hypothetical protein
MSDPEEDFKPPYSVTTGFPCYDVVDANGRIADGDFRKPQHAQEVADDLTEWDTVVLPEILRRLGR